MPDLNLDRYDFDEELVPTDEVCPFCLKLIPPDADPLDWWSPTECMHACCSSCAVVDDGLTVCPKCAEEGNGA